jgi:hypothetical protein
MIKGLNRVQGHAELTGQGLDEQDIGGDDTLIRSQGGRGFDGVNALGEHAFHAHMMVAKEGLQGGPPGKLGRFEGRPAAQKVTENARVFVLTILSQKLMSSIA